MNQVQYKVARGVIRLPRDPKSTRKFRTQADFIKQGELIPEGLLGLNEIESLLSKGIIEPLSAEALQAAAGRIPKTRGKWGVDPVALAGKTLEDLLVMILEIDPDYDVSAFLTEADAVRHLTQDWDPAFREEVARSTDRNRPEQLRSNGVKDAGQRPMSDAAEKALARAKSRAQAQTEAAQPGEEPAQS